MKKTLTIAIFIIYLQFIAYGNAWQLRLIPLTKDTMTGEWSALLCHDLRYGCMELSKPMVLEAVNSSEISTFFSVATNGSYAYSAQDLEKKCCSFRLSNGDLICYIPVPYISAGLINKKAHESSDLTVTKNNFVWLPIHEILQRRTIVKSAHGRSIAYMLELDIKKYFKEHWYTTVLPKMATAPMAPLKDQPMNLAAKNVQRRYEVSKKMSSTNSVPHKKPVASPVKEPKQPQQKSQVAIKKNIPTQKKNQLVMIKGKVPNEKRELVMIKGEIPPNEKKNQIIMIKGNVST